MAEQNDILIVTSSKSNAKAMAQAIGFLKKKIDIVRGKKIPKTITQYGFLIYEEGARIPLGILLNAMREDVEVALILTQCNITMVAKYLQERRIQHLLASPVNLRELQAAAYCSVEKKLLGFDRYFPEEAKVVCFELSTFNERCEALDEFEAISRKNRIRGSVRRFVGQIAEELLMNAMYQAPIDLEGNKLFAEVKPHVRIRRKTPMPVSFYFTFNEGSVFLAIRDRFGSFTRDNLANYLYRCLNKVDQIETKVSGAGLGLYLVTSRANKLVINILNEQMSEFICIVNPPKGDAQDLRLVSITSRKPANRPITDLVNTKVVFADFFEQSVSRTEV